MTMQRWEPFNEMLTLREAMGRLLEDSYVRPVGGAAAATLDPLPLDIFENGDGLEVSAALPGLRPEDVEITLQGDTLTIRGRRKAGTERKEGTYLMREQRGGNFYRTIKLPVLLDATKAVARFEHGILHLTLPKAESTKPRQIRITSGAPAVAAPVEVNNAQPTQQPS